MSEPEVLARRVRWLDRWRRCIAIGVAAVFAVFLTLALDELLEADRPEVHIVLFALVISAPVWWLVEAALAWLTAVWEVRAARTDPLPRAEIHRLGKRGS
jgi:hypothetical protein